MNQALDVAYNCAQRVFNKYTRVSECDYIRNAQRGINGHTNAHTDIDTHAKTLQQQTSTAGGAGAGLTKQREQ